MEEFLAFLNEKNAELLKNVGNVPVRKGAPDIEIMKNFSKEAVSSSLYIVRDMLLYNHYDICASFLEYLTPEKPYGDLKLGQQCYI